MGLKGGSGQRETEDRHTGRFSFVFSWFPDAATRRAEDPKDGRCGIERRLKGEFSTEIRWEDATLEEGNTRIRTFPLVASTLGE